MWERSSTVCREVLIPLIMSEHFGTVMGDSSRVRSEEEDEFEFDQQES